MREFIISRNDAGQRVDRFMHKAVPRLPESLLQRSIRQKRIKINGKRCRNSTLLCEGDRLQAYLTDELFDAPDPGDFMAAAGVPRVVYEDSNVMLLDKPAGALAHEDEHEAAETLINQIKKTLFERGEYDPAKENSFAPALCNRLDRGTSGLMLAAKNAPALRALNAVIRARHIDKTYLCIVCGRPRPDEATLKAFLTKDAGAKQVTVSDRPRPGALTVLTRYRVLRAGEAFSLLEVELLTGRTHQIRAHMAHIGHPLLGDGKYGRNAVNRATGQRRQALIAFKLHFNACDELGPLAYLAGRTFTVDTEPITALYSRLTGENPL